MLHIFFFRSSSKNAMLRRLGVVNASRKHSAALQIRTMDLGDCA
jgi:hypothetical protein